MQTLCTVQDGTAQRSAYFIAKIFYQKEFYDAAMTVSKQCHKQAGTTKI